MALQLETLSFQVDSTQLDDARIKIAKLGDAVASLNRPMQDMQRSSAKTAEIIAKSELATEKARIATEKLADSTSEVKTKVDPLTKLMEKLSNVYTDMANGMTKGESSILNQARSYGAMGTQLQAVVDILQNIKTLNKDPFDASLGGVRSITQEFERLQQRADLAAQGILMTTKQLGEYSKLAAEARGRVVGLGMDPDSLEGQKAYNQLLSQSQKEYLDVLSVVKQLTDAEQQRLAVAKEQERLQKAAASASAARMQEWAKGVGSKSPEMQSMASFYKEQEIAAKRLTAAQDDLILREQKLAFVNKELAAGLTTASANALFKYQNDLKAIGETTENITKRSTAFRAALVEKQGHSPIKKIADDAAEARKQVDHLARALGPQITDIFVGLATGQSPLTILLQQGGQLRDQIALAGVESSKMGDSLRTAASYMVTSVKDVAVAITQLLGSAVVGVGKKVTDLSLAMFGMSDAFAALSSRSPILGTALAAVVGTLGGVFLANMIALGVAFFKVQKNLDDLTKTLILSGGSLGLTTDSAVSLAISMEDVGISSSKAMVAIQAMAKEGGFARSEIQMITQSSVEMQKYLGVAVEDTVKQFAKLKGEPVDALLEVAKTTGLIPPEILATVVALKDQGKEAEAAAVAMKAYSDATIEQVQRAKAEYTDFGRFMIELGGLIGSFWDSIKGVVIKASPTQELENLRNEMQRNLDFSFTDTQKKYWSTQLESVNKQILRQQELNSAVEQERVANVKNAKVLEEARKIEIASMGTLEKLQKNKQIAEDRIANARKDSDLTQVARNAIITASEKELLKINEDISKELKKNTADRDKETKKQENYYQRVLNQANDYYEKITGDTENLTKAEVELLQIKNDQRWQKLTEREKQELTTKWQKNAAIEEELRLTKEQHKINIAAGEARNKLISDGVKEVENIQQRVKDQQIALGLLEYENSLIGTTQSQREYLVALKKEELEYEKKLAEIKGKGYLSGQEADAIAELNKEFELRKKILSASTYQKEFKEMQDVLSGAIADALFEGGKKGADSLKNYLQTTFRNYVIKVFIEPIVGNLLSSLGVKGGSGKLGDFASVVNQGGGLFGGYSSGLGTQFAPNIISAGNTAGRWLYDMGFEQAGEALVNTFNSVSEAGKTISSVGNYAGDALAYLNAFNTALKNPYAGTGQAIGYYFGGPIGSYLGGEIGKAVGDLLGYSGGDPDAFLVQQAQGTTQSYRNSVTSRLGTVGFVNGNATIMKNGRLISEYGETEDVSSSFQKAALSTIQALDNAIAANMSEQQIKETSDILSGWFKKSWSFSGGMLEGWLTSRYELILQSLDSSFGKVKDYQKEGEKLTDTTIRLITNLTTVKNTFDNLGISAEIVTAKFATNLADMLGGIDNFSSSMQFFYENFFSEEEKMQRATEGLTKAFAAMNLTVPETKDQFRALLEGALSSGDLGLSASLLALMQPFNDFIAANEELQQSINETVDSIQEEINRLRGENLVSSIVSGTALRTEFDIMSALARGGDITALAKLPEYSQAIEKNMQDFASSASDVIFARAMLAQSLTDTMSSLGGNTTVVPTSVSNLAGSTSIATSGAADLTANVGSQGDLVSMLIAEIQGLRAEVRADVSANSKTAKILERANQDGETLSVTVV